MTGDLKLSSKDINDIVRSHFRNKFNLETYERDLTFGIVLDGVEHDNMEVYAVFGVKQ